MKPLIKYAIVLFVCAVFTGCSSDDIVEEENIDINDPDVLPTPMPTMYMAGVANHAGTSVATYWKDSVATHLTSSYPDVHTYSSAAFSIHVSDGDVYVAGVTHTSKGFIATYWKNGQAFHLSPETHAQANDIEVVGNDVYVVGIMSAGNGYSYGVIWKNGVESKITSGEIYSQLTSISISDGNIYVAGYTGKQGEPGYAAYWKNNDVTLLTDGNFFACAKSIQVYGEDVYVTCPDVQVAKYWKNGQEIIIPETEQYETVSTIMLQGEDVYVAGLTDGSTSAVGKLTYWKNNTIQYRNEMVQHAEIGAIALFKGDIFISGSLIRVSETHTTSSTAVCWKNGTAITLNKGDFDETNIFYASALVITP